MPKVIQQIEGNNSAQWESLIMKLTQRSTQRRLTQDDLDKRIAEVERLFPLPQKPVMAGAAPLPLDAYKGFL